MGKCPKCDCTSPDKKKKIPVYVKGGKKLGLYNGDIETGTYIDSNGYFITPEGFAIDDNGYIITDENNKPVHGGPPSYLDIEDYKYEGKPWLSQYEKKRLDKLNDRYKHPTIRKEHNELLIKSYFDLFNIQLDVPDKLMLMPTAMFKVWEHYHLKAKTVEVFWIEVFRKGEMV